MGVETHRPFDCHVAVSNVAPGSGSGVEKRVVGAHNVWQRRWVGGWWWEERVLCLCLVMGVKIIAKQTNAKQTAIKQTTRFWLHSILVNPGTIPVSILECPNSAGLRMH